MGHRRHWLCRFWRYLLPAPEEGGGGRNATLPPKGYGSFGEGTREIRVILYAKDDPFCAPADELSIEDVLAVEHDVYPTRWADVFQQGEVDSIGDRVALTQDPGDFARLPVDDARQDQVQAAAGVHLLPQLAGVDPAAPPVKDLPGQGVEFARP
jgi:hypothetical protein